MITQTIENPTSDVEGNSADFCTIVENTFHYFRSLNSRFYLPALRAYTPQKDLEVIQRGVQKSYDNINTGRLRSNSRAILNLNSAKSKVLGNADLTSNIGSFLPQKPPSNEYGGKKTKRLQKKGRKSKKKGRKSKKRGRKSKKRKSSKKRKP
jgi:hypothetical protein